MDRYRVWVIDITSVVDLNWFNRDPAFYANADPDPGFDVQKLYSFTALKRIFFLWKMPRPPEGLPSYGRSLHKRTSTISKYEILHFFLFVLLDRIRIRLSNADTRTFVMHILDAKFLLYRDCGFPAFCSWNYRNFSVGFLSGITNYRILTILY
jgi:hypothetical protein